VAASNRALTTLAFSVAADLGPLFAGADRGRPMIGIDIPIGLSDEGPRACDVEARRWLGRPRGSSVFPAPCRAVLGVRGFPRACAISRRTLGVALSRQTYNILPKIREVDAIVRPGRQAFVREVHPELVFAILAGRGRGLAEPKRTAAGERVRLGLLREVAPAFDPGAVRAELGRAQVTRDDIVDAVACLVASRRIATGHARVLPEGAVARDARGLRMEIVA
jgi:predicted RNase H-like nuclease